MIFSLTLLLLLFLDFSALFARWDHWVSSFWEAYRAGNNLIFSGRNLCYTEIGLNGGFLLLLHWVVCLLFFWMFVPIPQIFLELCTHPSDISWALPGSAMCSFFTKETCTLFSVESNTFRQMFTSTSVTLLKIYMHWLFDSIYNSWTVLENLTSSVSRSVVCRASLRSLQMSAGEIGSCGANEKGQHCPVINTFRRSRISQQEHRITRVGRNLKRPLNPTPLLR